jgi:hypothetical protein
MVEKKKFSNMLIETVATEESPVSNQGRRSYKAAWRALRFRCARGVKYFSQRAQRLKFGR